MKAILWLLCTFLFAPLYSQQKIKFCKKKNPGSAITYSLPAKIIAVRLENGEQIGLQNGKKKQRFCYGYISQVKDSIFTIHFSSSEIQSKGNNRKFIPLREQKSQRLKMLFPDSVLIHHDAIESIWFTNNKTAVCTGILLVIAGYGLEAYGLYRALSSDIAPLKDPNTWVVSAGLLSVMIGAGIVPAGKYIDFIKEWNTKYVETELSNGYPKPH